MKQQQSFGIIDEIEKVNPLLRDRFLEPPFSVLDTKQDSWQDRKRGWVADGSGENISTTGFNPD